MRSHQGSSHRPYRPRAARVTPLDPNRSIKDSLQLTVHVAVMHCTLRPDGAFCHNHQPIGLQGVSQIVFRRQHGVPRLST